jgi:two-component system chemotaxis response regulator CheB
VAPDARSVVAVGASAGGVEALAELLSALPSDLGAPVLVVLHTAPGFDSRLPEVLARTTALPTAHARDGEELLPNRVYVAPPDHHLLAVDGHVQVVRGPHENRHRPAIDPLLRSCALSFREGVVAVVLTGALDDGAAGAVAVERMGGRVLVQDPAEAPFPSMPLNTIAADDPDAVLPLSELGPAILAAIRNPPARRRLPMDDEIGRETDYAALDEAAISREEVFAQRAPFSCPSCGGTLWEAPEDEPLRFRCRIGHAFGADSLLVGQSEALDASLAAALRALEERADLARRVGARLVAGGHPERAERYDRIRGDSERNAAVIRKVLLERDADGA